MSKPDAKTPVKKDKPTKEGQVVQELEVPVEEFFQQLSYSGPLPPAKEFAAYDKTTPGAGERILDMAERQLALKEREQKFVHAQWPKDQKREFVGRLVGQMLGAGALAFLAYLGYLTLRQGNNWGVVFLAAPVMALLTIIVRANLGSKDRD